jgi:dTDP-4-dehydrorhamnose reductase
MASSAATEMGRRTGPSIDGGPRRAPPRTEAPASDGVLLTGATGFIGMELLARYLERTDRRVYALVRGADERAAARRMERTLCSLFGAEHPYAERVVTVRGDLARPGLGLRDDGAWLAQQISEIVHGGASVSFELDLEGSRAINVEGTRRVLELSERCHARGGLRRLSHISTAYVAGDHAGCFSEDELDVGQSFRNAYEQSKFEAERLVVDARARMPITVLRPSIVVGERDSGWTTSFNVQFTTEETAEETRGHWYYRQLLGSANLTGGKLLHLLSGNLSHQIEHHLFPDLPSHRYAEIAGDVREICQRYGLPYNSGPLPRQFGSVVRKIVRLAFPSRPRPAAPG